jgi:3-(3-hydroxy-phenyl)propionate hydroxylase
VIDTVNDRHDQRYAMHHGDPRRPHVIVPGRDGFCRYEFLLLPGEANPGELVPFEFVRRLLEPYRPHVREEDVIRRTVYTFHALLAGRLQAGRCFLLGDAAHMMPPFAGAGLNTGVRDADNLAWKLAAVIAGQAGPRLLESYESERRPHSEAMVRLSVRLGRIMMTTSRRRARVRDAAIAAANLWPPSRRYLAQMRFRPQPDCLSGFALNEAPAERTRVTGRLLPQPTVLRADGRRALLDDVLGPGFSVLALGTAGAAAFGELEGRAWERLRPARVEVAPDDRSPARGAGWERVADLDGLLVRELAGQAGRLVLVRPDRYAAAVFRSAAAREVGEVLLALLGEPEAAQASRRRSAIQSAAGPAWR